MGWAVSTHHTTTRLPALALAAVGVVLEAPVVAVAGSGVVRNNEQIRGGDLAVDGARLGTASEGSSGEDHVGDSLFVWVG